MNFYTFRYLFLSIHLAGASGHDGYESEQLRNVKRVLILTKSNEILCEPRRQTDGSLIAFGHLKLSLLNKRFDLTSPVQTNCSRVLFLAQSIAQGRIVRTVANFILSREFQVDSYTGRPIGSTHLTCTVLVDIGDGLSFAQFASVVSDTRSCQ